MSHPAPDPDGERALLARLRRGDDAAYEELVRRHGGRLLAVARRFLDEDEAQDAVQDALLSAFRALDRFEGNARISTWLHRIVVNAALMRIRGRRRRAEDPIEDMLPRFDDSGHAVQPAGVWRPLPEDAVEREQLRDLVRSKIEELPESYRAVLVARDLEELDTRETAEALGISSGNVKVRLHRARQALRELLDPHLREDRA